MQTIPLTEVPQPILGEPKVVLGFIMQPPDMWRRKGEMTPGSEHPGHLLNESAPLEEALKHLKANDCVARGCAHW